MLTTLLPAPTSANVFGTGIANSDPQSKCTVAQSKFSKPFIKFKKIAPRENSLIYVTGPAKRDQVGTKYTISQNGAYLKFFVQYLLSVSSKILHMKVLIDGENFTYIALADHWL